MKVLIAIGMIIVFISSFFIFFITDWIGKKYMDCYNSETKTVCSFKAPDAGLFLSFAFIGFFIMLSIITMYIIFRNIREFT